MWPTYSPVVPTKEAPITHRKVPLSSKVDTVSSTEDSVVTGIPSDPVVPEPSITALPSAVASEIRLISSRNCAAAPPLTDSRPGFVPFPRASWNCVFIFAGQPKTNHHHYQENREREREKGDSSELCHGIHHRQCLWKLTPKPAMTALLVKLISIVPSSATLVIVSFTSG